MLLMLAEALQFCAVSAARPESTWWKLLCHHQTHTAWAGCSLHDLIQPGFFFLVGAALAFSIGRRQALRQPFSAMLVHVLRRSAILIGLGLLITALHPRQVVWQFDETLIQIGLAYPVAFLLAFLTTRGRWISFGVLLIGYWLWFALSPLPAPAFPANTHGLSANGMSAHSLVGFSAHWQKHDNPASVFDRWLLNLFPRDTLYLGSSNGLTTLNFIPSVGTMLLGLMAADVLRGRRAPQAKVRCLFLSGVVLLSTGWVLGALGICPVVKALWTPSWVLFSGGWCYVILAALYILVDATRNTRWAFPLIVVGANSIAAYTMAHVHSALAFGGLRRILGAAPFQLLGDAYEPLLYGGATLLGYWLVLFILYRRRILLRL